MITLKCQKQAKRNWLSVSLNFHPRKYGAIELSETPYNSQKACLCKSEAHINTYLHYGAVTANRARLREPHSIQTTAMPVNFQKTDNSSTTDLNMHSAGQGVWE